MWLPARVSANCSSPWTALSPDSGKGADQAPGRSAWVTPASHSDLLAADSWPWAPKPKNPARQIPYRMPVHRMRLHSRSHLPAIKTAQVDTTESRSDDAGVPNEISGDIERAADRGWIALLPSHFGPHFMAHGPVSTSLPNPSVRSPFCVGLLGMRLAGQDEQLAGQRGTGCERSQSSPTSNSIIYLRFRLL